MLCQKIKFFAILFVGFVVFTGCSSSNGPDAPSFGGGTSSDGTKIIDTPNMHKATMRPYTIDGKTYYPTMVSVGDTFSGVASWYGKDFHGKKTSNGEIYNMNDMTAAHKTFPMNTMLKVTNLKNNKSVVVRVNDRGPFVGTRIIDLSYLAATRLELAQSGTGPVGLEVIGFSGVVAPSDAPKQSVVMGDYFVQIGAYRSKENAQKFVQQNMGVNGHYNAVLKEGTFENQPIYRVWLKGFESSAEAEDFMAKGKFKGSFIVKE